MSVQPYTINVPDDVLEDLRHRLNHARWPDEIPGAEWDYGSNLDYIKELVAYWQDGFDWRKAEAGLNAFANFYTTIAGQGIHFIHEKGKGPDPMPIIVTHGWPGSIYEMHKIIPLLTDPASHGGDPADSFDVVVPSMPGYGFSAQTRDRGVNTRRIAELWDILMADELGYQRYAAQGGDWGAGVTARLGFHHANHVLGIHTTSVTQAIPYQGASLEGLSMRERLEQVIGTPQGGYRRDFAAGLSDDELAMIDQRVSWQAAEGGYAHIQGTKPQTLGYGLNDSPAGLAAWIVEKYRTWSDCGGDVERRFTKDELLTTVTIYWVTETIGSSTRMYKENQRYEWTMEKDERIEAPTGVAAFPEEISRPPREWAERSYNLQRWTSMPRGGHFAALEEPELLAQEIREFFRPLRGG
jgi:microsomal epoxide hydrolase